MTGQTTYYSRDEVREIDRRAIEEFGLPGIVLMENAGRGCAHLLLEQKLCGPVAICCGRGNNGGDGYVIARHLENAGVDVHVLLFASIDAVSGDAGTNLHVLRVSGTPLREFREVPEPGDLDRCLRSIDWVVDALLGTGTRGTIREPFRSAIDAMNRASARVLAVDLPSGLDCDTGEPLGPCVQADVTATFVGRKRGFLNPLASRYTGAVHVIDIGAPRQLLTSPVEQEE